MYNIKIATKDNELTIPINEYCNKHKDINVDKIIHNNSNEIYSFLINNNSTLDGIEISLFDNDIFLVKKAINKIDNITFFLTEIFPDSQLRIEDIVEELILSLKHYDMTIENNEIIKVTLDNEIIDTKWFIENIYRNTEKRYYRKILTFKKFLVLERDTDVN